MSIKETDIQQSCVRWFNLQCPQYRGLLIAIPNGGSRNPREGAKLKREGVVAGVADLQLIIARQGVHSLFIEMKTPSKTSRQQPPQKEWQKVVETQGFRYVICRDLEGFIVLINEYLKE